MCYHHGDSVDPEERDCPKTFSDIQDVQILCHFVKDYLPGLRPEPDIMERCMYTVSRLKAVPICKMGGGGGDRQTYGWPGLTPFDL